LDAVCEDAKLRLRSFGEVIGELLVVTGEALANLLGLDEEDGLPVLEEGPVDRLYRAVLAEVDPVLGNALAGVGQVVAEQSKQRADQTLFRAC